MKIVAEFSKIHQTLHYKMLSSRDTQREERTSWFEFYNLVGDYKCVTHLPKACVISGLLTQSGTDITLLSVRSTQLNTRFISWHKFFDFWKSRFPISRWSSIIQNFIVELSGYKSYYVTTLAFLTHSICYALQNAQ